MGVSFIFAFKIEYHCYGFSCIDIKTKLTEDFIQQSQRVLEIFCGAEKHFNVISIRRSFISKIPL